MSAVIKKRPASLRWNLGSVSSESAHGNCSRGSQGWTLDWQPNLIVWQSLRCYQSGWHEWVIENRSLTLCAGAIENSWSLVLSDGAGVSEEKPLVEEGTTFVVVEAPGLKVPWREVEAWYYVAGSLKKAQERLLVKWRPQDFGAIQTIRWPSWTAAAVEWRQSTRQTVCTVDGRVRHETDQAHWRPEDHKWVLYSGCWVIYTVSLIDFALFRLWLCLGSSYWSKKGI